MSDFLRAYLVHSGGRALCRYSAPCTSLLSTQLSMYKLHCIKNLSCQLGVCPNPTNPPWIHHWVNNRLLCKCQYHCSLLPPQVRLPHSKTMKTEMNQGRNPWERRQPPLLTHLLPQLVGIMIAGTDVVIQYYSNNIYGLWTIIMTLYMRCECSKTSKMI